VIANAVIAAAEKAGTTSLFRSLSEHPQVAPASVKETRYFQPILYGQELEPLSVYESYFSEAGDAPVRLEATPRYLYGGRALAERMHEVLGPDARVLMVLREPVARFASFFEFQKARLRIPEDVTADDYLKRSDAMTDADFRDPANHAWFGFRGGCYADWVPEWQAVFGDRLLVVFFEDLIDDTERTLRTVAEFLGIDPDRFPSYELSSENRTTGYKQAGFQKLALGLNDRFERFLRRHYKLKERLRAAYYRINGRGVKEEVPERVRAMLRERYEGPNRRLAGQLEAARDLPSWLSGASVVDR
jgi:hypothetical protein